MVSTVATQTRRRVSCVRHLTLCADTHGTTDIIDLTTLIGTAVQGLGFVDGIVTIATRHTTTGLLINEHEPLLMDDLARMFERLAPTGDAYAHDDLSRRTVNLGPDERRNGHAHCRAALLRTSESLPVSSGSLVLGRWQRILLVDFDAGQRRQLSLTVVGEVLSVDRPFAS